MGVKFSGTEEFTPPDGDISNKLVKVPANPKLLGVFWAVHPSGDSPYGLQKRQLKVYDSPVQGSASSSNFLLISSPYLSTHSPSQLSSSWTTSPLTPQKSLSRCRPHPAATHHRGIKGVPPDLQDSRPESWFSHSRSLPASCLSQAPAPHNQQSSLHPRGSPTWDPRRGPAPEGPAAS